MSTSQKTILITGAAGGIGRACSHEFAARGYHIAAADRDADGLKKLASELGTQVTPYTVDVRERAQLQSLADQAWEAHGGIDIVLNNAGVVLFGPFAETSLDDWEWILEINLWAPIRLSRMLAPRMIERKRGHIVVTASAAGLFPFPNLSSYTVSKFAMVGFCGAIRPELAQHGVDVTVVCPGPVGSNIASGGRYAGDGSQEAGHFGFAPSRGLTAEDAARRMADGIERREPMIVFPGVARTLHAASRISPALARQLGRGVFAGFDYLRKTRGKVSPLRN